jgi:hypothetical protein
VPQNAEILTPRVAHKGSTLKMKYVPISPYRRGYAAREPFGALGNSPSRAQLEKGRLGRHRQKYAMLTVLNILQSKLKLQKHYSFLGIYTEISTLIFSTCDLWRWNLNSCSSFGSTIALDILNARNNLARCWKMRIFYRHTTEAHKCLLAKTALQIPPF